METAAGAEAAGVTPGARTAAEVRQQYRWGGGQTNEGEATKWSNKSMALWQ